MNQAIYPETLAEMTKARAGEKYRPGNGTEGECFFAAWCCKCQRDKAMREGCDVDECDDNERCDIIAYTMCYDVEDAEYPTEWQIGTDGQPCCTAFVPAGEAIPEPRCAYTLDLFGGAA
jgi:hypothetical protein